LSMMERWQTGIEGSEILHLCHTMPLTLLSCLNFERRDEQERLP